MDKTVGMQMSDNNDFNINTIISETLGILIKDAAKEGLSLAKLIPSKKKNLKNYLETSYNNQSKTKTLLYRDTPRPLDEIFVVPGLRIETETISIPDLSKIFSVSNKIIISASAGSGKTILCKFIFLELVRKNELTIPIFISLQTLNDSKQTIAEKINSDMRMSGVNFSSSEIHTLIEKGKIALILDGFDEIKISRRKSITDEIDSFTNLGSECKILISTRPEEDILSWGKFRTVRVAPLTKEKAIELIEKLKYDEAVKEKFLKDLDGRLFKSHRDFLSNPLLLTIMLMTVSSISDIPEKLHTFYEFAFDALFFKHDISKDLYQRIRYSDLPIDEFKKVLAAFSMASYIKRDISFSFTKFNSHLSKAKKLTQIKFDKADYQSDLLKSVCIIQSDGLRYTYTHRSFQEYFSALYLKDCNRNIRQELFSGLLQYFVQDNTLGLLFEMDRDIVENELLIPELENLFFEVDGAPDPTKRFMTMYARRITFTCRNKDSKPFMLGFYRNQRNQTDRNFGAVITLISKLYRGVYPKNPPNLRRNITDKKIMAALKKHGTAGHDGRLMLTLDIASKKQESTVAKDIGYQFHCEAQLKYLRYIHGEMLKRQEKKSASNSCGILFS